jgi:hypothetical protein
MIGQPNPGSAGSGLQEGAAPALVVAHIGEQQRALLARVSAANTPGHLEGLFAYHVLSHIQDVPLSWNVNCATDEWLGANSVRLTQYPVLAVLGYSLYHFPGTAPHAAPHALAEGMTRLRARDPFPPDRISFAFDHTALLGLVLGTKALGEAGAGHRSWLASVIDDPRRGPLGLFQALLTGCIRSELTGEATLIYDAGRYQCAEERALLVWGVVRGALRFVDPRLDVATFQAQALYSVLLADATGTAPGRAAAMWAATRDLLARSTAEIVRTRSHVATVLRRFQAAMRRWRWDDPQRVRRAVRWPIVAEREVQDILWLVLRSAFDDVVDEESLPRVGHSTYLADFGIPSLKLLVEAKFARQAADFKKLEKEIMEDAAAYLAGTAGRYDRMLVFIYDDSSSVQEHDVTVKALRRVPGIEEVIIVSRPSQLPPDQDASIP